MACPICKKKNKNYPLKVKDYEYDLAIVSLYNQCKSCQTIYRKYPIKLNKSIERKNYIKSNYLPLKGNLIYNFLKSIYANYEIKKINNALNSDFFNKKKIILDIACGKGYLIKRFAKNRNHKCHAIDAYIKTHNINNVKFKKSSFDNFKLIKRINPDLIIINNFIEHVDDLKKINQMIHQMKKNSYLIIITPDANSVARKIFSDYWSGYHAPRHKVIFSEKSLNLFISKSKRTKYEQNKIYDPFSNIVSISNIVKQFSLKTLFISLPKLIYFPFFLFIDLFQKNRILLKVEKI